MHRPYFTKTGAPVWIHVPGTPFTLPGSPRHQERLPGMDRWVDRELVESVSQDLRQGGSIDSVAENVGRQGLLSSTVAPAVGGGVLGAAAGRLIGGAQSTAPFQEMLERGINSKTLKGLSRVGSGIKRLPLAGAALGATVGAGKWLLERGEREQQGRETAKGLLAERVLQRGALQEAVDTDQPYTGGLLRGIPQLSAAAETPAIVSPGNVGV